MKSLKRLIIPSFNSRTPGGVRPLDIFAMQDAKIVSIHAPREGCDVVASHVFDYVPLFQFTHPGRGAT